VSSQDFSPAPFPIYADNGTVTAQSFPVHRTRERYWLYCLLFATTLLTATLVGAAMQMDFNRNLPFRLENVFPIYAAAWRNPAILLRGLPFSITMLGILLVHEFGHYFAALWHRVDASLPYFLPSPVLGTFGAFIRVRSPIYSKRALFDIGISGPIAGFIFLVPALSVGIAFSKVIPGIAHHGSFEFGTPLLQWLLEQAIFPGVSVQSIQLHPMWRAAWVGMFATAMNLLPIGQLDGGHIVYAFFPEQHRWISRALCLLMVPLWSLWPGWTVWGLVLLWLGRRHPVVYDPTELTPGRRRLGWVALAIFLACICPQPFGR